MNRDDKNGQDLQRRLKALRLIAAKCVPEVSPPGEGGAHRMRPQSLAVVEVTPDVRLLRAIVEKFANMDLTNPEDARRIFERVIKERLGEWYVESRAAKPDGKWFFHQRTERPTSAAVLSIYQSEQRQLRLWLSWLSGEALPELPEQSDLRVRAEIAELCHLSSTDFSVAEFTLVQDLSLYFHLIKFGHHFDRKNGQWLFGLSPFASTVEGFIALSMFWLVTSRTRGAVRRCPECKRFIFNDGAAKPRRFCSPKHSSTYHKRIQREDAKIKALRERGLDRPSIAKVLGLTIERVREALR